MKLKYKILICFAFISILSIFNFSNVKASSVNLEDYKTVASNNPVWFIIHTLNTDEFYMICTTNSIRQFGFYLAGNCTDPSETSSNYIFETTDRRGFYVYKLDKGSMKFNLLYDLPSLGKFQPNDTWEFIACNKAVLGSNSSSSFLYRDVTPVPSKYIYGELPTLEWSFDRRVNTIIMSSQCFDLDTITKYNLYYTTDSSSVDNYTSLPCASIGSVKNDDLTSYFYFLTFDNYSINDVTYYFVLEEKDTGRILASTFKVKFGELNSYFDNELNNSLVSNGLYGQRFTRGIPNLDMHYSRHSKDENNFYYEIYSQYFSKTEVSDTYIAYYTSDITKLDDFSSWDNLSIATFKDTKTGQVNYYYFFTLPTDFEETTYYFVLYNKKTGEYGSVSSLKLKPDKMWEYSDALYNDNNIINSRFDNLINNLKSKFGFLFYPFELIGDIFNRFLNINWEEPILTIPSIDIPVFGDHVMDEFHYNFNNLLSIPVVKYIHSVYLIFANVIIIYCLLQFASKVFEEVLGHE